MNVMERRRIACDECRTRKLKCSGEQPECSRCINDNIACVYSTQKAMGRPRKRKIGETDQSTNEQSQEISGRTSSAGSNFFDSAIEFDSLVDQINFPNMDLPDLNTITDVSLLTASAFKPLPTQSCACLSSIYLTLENLRSMVTIEFPSSLQCLRDALHTSKSCIDCQVCPVQYLTATQNAQLIGTLLISIAERYDRILKDIASDATKAEEAAQMKTLHIGGLETPRPRHEHIGGIDSNEPLVLELPPLEWRKLANRVVKAEVYGTSVASRINFVSVLTSLEERQARWHIMEPTEDCPNPARRRHDMHDHNNNPMCLMLAREAKKLVDLFDFS
ncbi:unnamed protein product [Aureobasidium uvarum]|uniref:Zn(2)-C6 fungal-type domain-containing protein n=1 Tax=Aureobasidium uvarum TaxID=2773716 RepID=A0A9N8K981_9PEZI|nr:unnamed protein product [Aureobasidium uvarum]